MTVKKPPTFDAFPSDVTTVNRRLDPTFGAGPEVQKKGMTVIELTELEEDDLPATGCMVKEVLRSKVRISGLFYLK